MHKLDEVIQCLETDNDNILHYGVRGMKWDVEKVSDEVKDELKKKKEKLLDILKTKGGKTKIGKSIKSILNNKKADKEFVPRTTTKNKRYNLTETTAKDIRLRKEADAIVKGMRKSAKTGKSIKEQMAEVKSKVKATPAQIKEAENNYKKLNKQLIDLGVKDDKARKKLMKQMNLETNDAVKEIQKRDALEVKEKARRKKESDEYFKKDEKTRQKDYAKLQAEKAKLLKQLKGAKRIK